MIYKFDHVGITVQSLPEAREQLERLYPCFHVQQSFEVRDGLTEVSMAQPKRLSISLHERKGNISIELIEYPRVLKKTGSILPWGYRPDEPIEPLKASIQKSIERSLSGHSFTEALSLLETHECFNAVVIPVQDLSSEQHFWQELRFEKIVSDAALVIYRLKSLLPPFKSDYILFYEVDYSLEYYTDMEGVNEIALLCHSCSADLKSFPQEVFKSSVDTLLVNDKEISLGYLRSPSGVLAELFSVRLATGA